MTRICIIGDSHVGALKYGWDSIRADYPDVEITFFATPGRHVGDVVLQEGVLTGRTAKVRETYALSSGGLENVVPADYDRFALVAMGIGLRNILTLYTRYRLDHHHGYYDRFAPVAMGISLRNILTLYTRYRLDHHRGYKAPNFVSPKLFRELGRASLKNANATRLRDLLASMTDASICFVPEPLPSEDLPTTLSYDENLRAIFSGGFDADVAAVYEDLVEEIRMDGTEVVPQPQKTKRSASLTKREYCVGSIRVAGSPRPADERLHMNGLYGAEVLELLLRTER